MLHHILDKINPWPASVLGVAEQRNSSGTEQWVRALQLSFLRSLSAEEAAALAAEHRLPAGFFTSALQEMQEEIQVEEEGEEVGAPPPSGALAALALCTPLLLAQGGDDPLALAGDDQQNKYRASPFSRPGVISRSSCTCSTVTSEVII